MLMCILWTKSTKTFCFLVHVMLNFYSLLIVPDLCVLRTDASFASLDTLLSEALPVLLHKSHLLVLTANFCTLGLMINRLQPTLTGTCV